MSPVNFPTEEELEKTPVMKKVVEKARKATVTTPRKKWFEMLSDLERIAVKLALRLYITTRKRSRNKSFSAEREVREKCEKLLKEVIE